MKKNAGTDTKVCVRCGGTFARRPEVHITLFSRRKFCGTACMHAAKVFTPGQVGAAFWAKVDKSGGEAACWPWTGAITTHGYGCFNVKRRVYGAHKYAYMLTKGPVPAGMHVMHSCDNRPCCNPAHLSLGTALDNAADKVAKGRQARRGGAKLTEDSVREIRSLRGIEQSGSLAKRFNVDQPHIINIWNRRVWKGVA